MQVGKLIGGDLNYRIDIIDRYDNYDSYHQNYNVKPIPERLEMPHSVAAYFNTEKI